jgi:hypothetical protein
VPPEAQALGPGDLRPHREGNVGPLELDIEAPRPGLSSSCGVRPGTRRPSRRPIKRDSPM